MKNLKLYKRALIIVDMVNGFAKEGGSLYDPAINKLIPRQVKLVKETLNKEDALVVFIKDTHDNNSVEFDRFGNTGHCVRESGEEEVVDLLSVFEGLDNVISFEKNSTSFMEIDDFRKLIDTTSNIEEIEVVDCCTDICISNSVIPMMNHFDQQNKRVDVKVYEDLTETFDSEKHNRGEYSKAAYLLMAQQGAKILKKY